MSSVEGGSSPPLPQTGEQNHEQQVREVIFQSNSSPQSSSLLEAVHSKLVDMDDQWRDERSRLVENCAQLNSETKMLEILI